jgi:TrkA domain protein
MSFTSRDMPGIGTKYELDTEEGDRVSIIYMEGEGVQLYVRSGNGDYCSADLTPPEARRIGNVLTGAILETDEEEICMVFSSFADLKIKMHTYRLGDRTSGKTIADLNIRRSTGVTVVAVSRKGQSILNPSPSFLFEAGDSALVIGNAEQTNRFEEEFVR